MIKLRTYDNKDIYIVRAINNNYLFQSLSHFETVSKKVDILNKKYNIIGTKQVQVGNTLKLIDAAGFDAKKLYEDGAILIKLTQNYGLYIRTDKQDFYYRLLVSLVKNDTLRDIGGGFSVGCINDIFITGASTSVNYANIAKIMLVTTANDIKNISDLAICYSEQNITGDTWTDVGMKVSYFYTDGSGSTSDVRIFFKELRGAVTFDEPDTPNVPDINGDYDNASDVIDVADIIDINTMSAIQSNLVKAYSVTTGNLSELADFLWSDNFIDVIKKLQNDPIQNIQKLCYLPFDYTKGDADNIFIGNSDTGISAPRIYEQFQEVDFGNLEITEYYGNSLDYETDIAIFLPFIGEKTLGCVDIMGGTINLKYRVDILTGTCVAIISAVRVQNDVTLKSVLYTFSGDMSNEVPLTASQNNFFKSLVSNPADVEKTLTTAATGGALAMIGGMSHSYSHTGSIGGNVGFLSVLTPYLIIRRPVNVKPADYEKTFGYPAYTSVTLKNQKGYCRYKECYFDYSAYLLEKDITDEILTKLKTKGIYIK